MKKNKKSLPINYRPHHFLCSIGWKGMGYSPAFNKNMDFIVNEQLKSPGGDEVLLKVVKFTDDLCSPCPHKRDSLCSKQQTIETLDNAHSKKLNLFSGEILSWREAKQRIVKNVQPKDLDDICQGCQWLEYGVCKQSLKELINSKD